MTIKKPLGPCGPVACSVAFSPDAAAGGFVHCVDTVQDDGLKLVFSRKGSPWKLAELMPLVESCGLVALTEMTLPPKQVGGVWKHEVICEMPAGGVNGEQNLALLKVLNASFEGAEVDSLNRLAISASLGLREIGVWRAWLAYLQQIDARWSCWQMRRVVRNRPDLARGLWLLFAERFDPQGPKADGKGLLDHIEHELVAMPDAAQERVWRMLVAIVDAVVRTNVWSVKDGEALAFKIDPARALRSAGAKPWREIFVYHRDVEGVHLRGGPVARGGIRHSEREHDYRTEVLGLMLAQMRKNTIIVPVGAKGGFVLRNAKDSTPARVEENYRRYIRALLSVTDTLDAGSTVVHPVDVICRDGEDPYLVVAADKGTAKLSDAGNDEAVSAAYWGLPQAGFWLGDAFASGGSRGYNHKEMGITARGAWVSVLSHASALGISPRAQRLLVMVGIGDMGGDVFGNAMVRSPHVQLVGAFNHAHIFVDPNPDPAASFAERERLLKLGKGWDAYDLSKLSQGGGIYPRTAKMIMLSPEAQERLGTAEKQLPPEELIKALLKAPVDCLYNGGIGTYIKASNELHAAATDKANDDVRVDARDVRAKIIGEGGNLGLTPAARVELALGGVKINTDALDNSAGVSTSDHEVNLKILLDLAVRQGKIENSAKFKLLREMTDEVAQLVLRDNKLQNLVLSMEEAEDAEYHRELFTWQGQLVAAGFADTRLDHLPGERDFAARATTPWGARYVRPELCNLLAATKAWLRAALLNDRDLLECDAVKPLLGWYFPVAIRTRFNLQIAQHPLAREITATALANLLVNRLGLLGVVRLKSDFDAGAAAAARACVAALAAARIMPLWDQLDTFEMTQENAVRTLRRLKQVVGLLAAWVLKHGQPVDLLMWLRRLHGPCGEILHLLPDVLTGKVEMEKWRQEWRGLGLDSALAEQMTLLSPLSVAPDVVVAAEGLKLPVGKVLATHLQVGEILKMPVLMRKLRDVQAADVWVRKASLSLSQELMLRQRRLTEDLLRNGVDVAMWAAHDPRLARTQLLLKEIMHEKEVSPAMMVVLIGRLREMETA